MEKKKKLNYEDCDCEHHHDSNSHSHPHSGKCYSELWADTLIDKLKKEFESEDL